ncbi:MAG: hypothetical protein E6Q50_01260 [Lysobacter sp.]|nr:MAG: hypothetical protein E6Q50_01260 [Lysobacter sp.]
MGSKIIDWIAFTRFNPNRPLYERDIMNFVCLPDGAIVTLSYRKKWVETRSWSQCASGKFLSKELLIALYLGDEKKSGTVYPLRFANILSAEIHEKEIEKDESDGQVVTLCVRLGRRPSADHWGALATTALEKAAYDPEKPLEIFLSAAAFKNSLNKQAAALAWHEQVKRLKMASPDACINRHWVFFEGIKTVDKKTGRLIASCYGLNDAKVTSYELTAGKSYEIDCLLHQETLSDLADTPVSATVVGSHMEVFPASLSQVGMGASINFLIVTQRKFSSETIGVNFLVLKNSGKDGDKPVPVARGTAPEFYCRVRIAPPFIFLPFTFFLLFFGAIFLSLSSESIMTFDRYFFGCWFSNQFSVKFADFLSIILKALGGLLLAIANIYALRKLPFGK